MSAPAAADAAAPPKPKGKKMLVIIIAVVLLLVAAGGGWFVFLRHPAEEGGEEAAHAPVAHAEVKPGVPPVFMPMDNMVVNLADPGGEKFAQVGITIAVADQKVADAVKANLPTIRSAVLLLISQRTSEDLLTKEGKEKLAREVLREVSTPLGYEVEDEEEEEDPAPKKKGKKKRAPPPNPILNVLFSSFIIQ